MPCVDTFARDRLPPPELWPRLHFDLPELRYPKRLNCATVLLDDAIAEGHGERPAILTEAGNFRTDLYVAEGAANLLARRFEARPREQIEAAQGGPVPSSSRMARACSTACPTRSPFRPGGRRPTSTTSSPNMALPEGVSCVAVVPGLFTRYS